VVSRGPESTLVLQRYESRQLDLPMITNMYSNAKAQALFLSLGIKLVYTLTLVVEPNII
jgi:hypothetical protein